MPGMAEAGFRLGIDLGTSNTVGCLRREDGPVTPLLFDASALLPSTVFAGRAMRS
jgi:molecular chaperone DnaK (HSP70)